MNEGTKGAGSSGIMERFGSLFGLGATWEPSGGKAASPLRSVFEGQHIDGQTGNPPSVHNRQLTISNRR